MNGGCRTEKRSSAIRVESHQRVDEVTRCRTGNDVNDSWQKVRVVENPTPQMRCTGAVKRAAADLSAAGDEEVAAGAGVEGHQEQRRNTDGKTERHQGDDRGRRTQNDGGEKEEHEAEEHRR